MTERTQPEIICEFNDNRCYLRIIPLNGGEERFITYTPRNPATQEDYDFLASFIGCLDSPMFVIDKLKANTPQEEFILRVIDSHHELVEKNRT